MNGKLPLIVELQEMVALIVATKKFFFVLHKRRRGEKGAAVACGGEKPSCEWFFSAPGWRRHCPSAGGESLLLRHLRAQQKCCARSVFGEYEKVSELTSQRLLATQRNKKRG